MFNFYVINLANSCYYEKERNKHRIVTSFCVLIKK